MTSSQDHWNASQHPLGPSFNRQQGHPPVLPPPANLEAGPQTFYTLPNLPSLGNGVGHSPPGHTFTIPSINSNTEPVQPPSEHARRPSEVSHNGQSQQLPPPSTIAAEQLQLQQQQQQQQPRPQPQSQQQVSAVPPPSLPQGVPNRSTSTSVYRPLNVRDALSYLEQVKVQFFQQADVYNNFLDIMKEFKTQRIECSLDPSDPNPIRVTTPTGTTTRPNINANYEQRWGSASAQGESQQQQQQVAQEQGQQQQFPPQIVQYRQQQQLEEQQQQQQDQNGGQIEFNHAISYVNKIKTRFANQPDIYKQFLEILQTYQREQKPIGEVYEQVTVLFANSPDLLDDFKQFLPDTRTQGYAEEGAGSAAAAAATAAARSANGAYYGPGSQLPPVGNFQPPIGTNSINPYGAPGQYHQGYPIVPGITSEQAAHEQQQQYHHHQQQQQQQYQQQQQQYQQQQQHLQQQHLQQQLHAQHHQAQENQQHVKQQEQQGLVKERKSISDASPYENANVPAATGNAGDYSGIHSSVQPVTKKAGTPGKGTSAVTNPTLVPGVPEPVPPSATAKSSSLQEEIGFFDKVKKAIGNKQTYNEFLKILNLFSQDIIDKETLVERVEVFIGDGHPELIQWFKLFVGYEPKPQHIENITFKKHQLELSLCKAYGPSYRQLPKSETYMPCSGRDEMCWEVLNDEWVGHPTWASEDSGFIAHRKNQYEEILFKIEEERHEFDYYMESNLRTIQTLETIANRIANMTPEQKVSFKLPPGLGHNSSTIYKKVIRKIYDKDRGYEVIDALHENPAIAVPIVLKRLKQKDEEWKRSHREWNKVWREMEQKVFYKSLDHLGLTFKQADKKLLTAKQLVSEISTVKVEQQNKRLHPLTPKPQEQLNYEFTDNDILVDILKLTEVFINRSSNYSANDREKLCQFFKYFLSLFFGISNEAIENGLSIRSKENKESETEVSPADKKTDTSNGSSKKRGRDTDLLKDVLKKQSKTRKDETVESPQQSESDEQEYSQEVEKSGELWIKTTAKKYSLNGSSSNSSSSSTPSKDDEESRRSKYYLFCNTTIYVFFRHLRTLYERLYEVKNMNEEVGKEIRSRKVVQFAKDLNLISHQLEDLNIQIVGSKNCYHQVLDLSEKLIEGDLEHQWFEETVRQGYRNKAYKIYTIDKVVQSIAKHMHSMISDSKTSDMMVLFENDRSKPQSTAKDQILYRMQVRSLMSNDENMFKITLDETDNTVNIQFVSLDDLTINDQKNSEEDYNYYVTSYVMSHPTEGIQASKINMPFLKSFIESIDEDQFEGYVNPGLKVSICENSYRLFFDANTHDEFTSNFVYQKQPEEKSSRSDKLTALNALINDDEEHGWRKTLAEGDNAASLEERVNILLNEGAEAFFEKSKQDDAELAIAESEEIQEATTEIQEDDTMEADEDLKKDDVNVDETVDKKDVTIEAPATPQVDEEKTENKDEESASTSFEAENKPVEIVSKSIAEDDVKQESEAISKEQSAEVVKVSEPDNKADVTVDADQTVIQNQNDTTIQQEFNDTADEVTINNDTTVFEDANSTTNQG